VSSDPSFVERLAGKKNHFMQSASDYRKMVELVRDGDGNGAIAVYKRLPEPLRREKAVMLAYVTASGKLGDDVAYGRALEEMREVFPTDRGLDLMFIDAHLIARRFPRRRSVSGGAAREHQRPARRPGEGGCARAAQMGIEIGDLTAHADYAEFVKTAEYRAFAQ
jgi:hypothetical protein